MYKVMRWTKSSSQLRASPLEIEGIVYETQKDRAQVLRSALLERRNLADDVEEPAEAIEATMRLDLDCTVTRDDARHACTSTGNTSSRADGITVVMLKAAWPSISTAVTTLFQASLRLGHYPQAFPEAEVVMIPKPGKDLTTARPWRPISLLSCLGEGLERLVAKRLAWAAITQKVVHPQQAGALPKRSCSDPALALLHDVELALCKRKPLRSSPWTYKAHSTLSFATDSYADCWNKAGLNRRDG
ncbi:hypothetical protein HIM_09897 [Hirsutella minnesotensis 3608]|uniref:Reverse transcriptase domain-containing protein n=1 Tax=Hirsutella minnesotensis 3608 TaxID=1043627 RepID=A0A0F7ZS43_9HYPO|nr:hypothetical protein HIM_09897 [Hirsutella minnesotensis 3608]